MQPQVRLLYPSGMDDDRQLVSAVLSREPGAFETLVTRYQGLVWHMVVRMVRHPDDARELSQEVFLRVHQRLGQFRLESALGTWIGRIAFSIASRHLQRKRLPMVEPSDADDGEALLDRVDDGFDLEAAMADRELMDEMVRALDALPAIQRTLVTLYHLDELGITEISAMTGLPEGTVKNYLFRARLRLRQRLESLTGAAA
jgi:RNA polymerase sigma factor (sigma-70 family)